MLSEAIEHGHNPATQTQVVYCPTETHTVGAGAGMDDPEYRKQALKHFLAFKALAKSHWERILEGVEEV